MPGVTRSPAKAVLGLKPIEGSSRAPQARDSVVASDWPPSGAER